MSYGIAWGWVMQQDPHGGWKVVQPVGTTLERWSGMDLAATVEDSAKEDGRYAFFTPLGKEEYNVKRTAKLVLPSESEDPS